MATAQISKQYQLRAHSLGMTDDYVLGEILDNWGSLIAYYSEGLELDRAIAPLADPASRQTGVLVPAYAADSRTVLELECACGGDGLWRVCRIGFAPKPTTIQPTSSSGTVSPP